jgi:hypothetical protein
VRKYFGAILVGHHIFYLYVLVLAGYFPENGKI